MSTQLIETGILFPDNTTQTTATSIGPSGAVGLTGAPGTDGTDGISIIWKGNSATHIVTPENNWSYYNTVDKKSYIYYDSAWHRITADGVDGTNGVDGISIIWKGNLSTPPASPQVNWAYKDTDDDRVYIYDGVAWEIMLLDGSNGIDGANGADGNSIFITYNDNLAEAMPANPTGNGTTSGWHTNATTASVWISQKVSVDASSGSWGTPIRIKGVDGSPGIPGNDGVEGTSVLIVYSSDAIGTTQSTTDSTKNYVLYYEYNGSPPSLPLAGETFVKWQGTDGVDGQSVWPVYATDVSGNNQTFVLTSQEYVTFYESTVAPSLPVVDETFVKWKGTDGAPGEVGIDGTSVLVVYAENSLGINRSLSAIGKEWVQYHEYTGSVIPSLDSISGTWVKFIGFAGSDGQSIYPVYADDANGTNQSLIVNNRGYVTFFESINAPTLPLVDQTFVKWEGTDGIDGDKGDRGPGRFVGNKTLTSNSVPNVSSATVDYFDSSNFDINKFDFIGTTDFATHALEVITNSLGAGSVPAIGDVVTVVYTKLNGLITSKTGVYQNELWEEFVVQLDGNEIVSNTVSSDKIQSYNLLTANASFEDNIIKTAFIDSNAITQTVSTSASTTLNLNINMWNQVSIASITVDDNSTSANIISFSLYAYITSGGNWITDYRVLRNSTVIETGKIDVSSTAIGTTINGVVIDANATLGTSPAYTVEVYASGNITSLLYVNNRKLNILGIDR